MSEFVQKGLAIDTTHTPSKGLVCSEAESRGRSQSCFRSRFALSLFRLASLAAQTTKRWLRRRRSESAE
jgi:hypothetical protein